MKHTCVYLLLTPDCNQKCKYCFQETDYRRQGRASASEEVIDAFVEYCVGAGAHHVEIFGGEPLLCKGAFERAVRAIRRESPDMGIGLVTNGTLIDERIMSLLEAEPVSVLLSLDGPKQRHDALRGGFDQVAKWFPRLARLGRATIALQAGIVPGLYDSVRYAWDLGFRKGVYINVIQSYGWYAPGDVHLFEREYEKCVQGMLRGEGCLLCAERLYGMLKSSSSPQQCGITSDGLTCDWNGTLYPCHRAPELGPGFAIGDVRAGLDEGASERLRAQIQDMAFGSESAGKFPLVSYCPVNTYKEHGGFDGEWAREFCEMIDVKAKLVAKYYYELADHFEGADGDERDRCSEAEDAPHRARTG